MSVKYVYAIDFMPTKLLTIKYYEIGILFISMLLKNNFTKSISIEKLNANTKFSEKCSCVKIFKFVNNCRN